jgi:hypothetical protein
MGMTRKFLMAAALAAGPLLAATAAHADVISIGLQETGVNGGAITTEASSATGNASITGVSYGTFDNNNVSGIGNPPLTSPSLLNSNSINVSSGTAGTLQVYVSESGITTPTGLQNFLSAFTENALTAGFTVQEQTFLDAADGVYALTTGLGNTMFTAIGTDTQLNAANAGTGPYSLTAVYTITSTGSGSANSTINVAVPEPASLTLFGTALVALGLFFGLRRKQV